MSAKTSVVPVGVVENDLSGQILKLESIGFFRDKECKRGVKDNSKGFVLWKINDGIKIKKMTRRVGLGMKMVFRCLLVLHLNQTSKGSTQKVIRSPHGSLEFVSM